MLGAAVLVGVAAGYGAIALHHTIHAAFGGFFRPFGITGGEEAGKYLPWYGLLLLPVVGGLILMPFLRWIAAEVRGAGISEVIESLAVRGGRMRKRVPLAKMVATSVSLGSGASAGREGPIVLIGGAIGSFLSHILRASVRQTRTLVACGAGAGVAATFNMPFAGALFAVEVILEDFGAAKIGPIVVSCVVATVISHHHLGDSPALMHVHFYMHSNRELLLYAALGIFLGLLSALMIQSVDYISRLFSRLPLKFWWYPAIGGLAVGLLALFTPHQFGVGYYQINDAISANHAFLLRTTLTLTFIKLLATAISVGSGTSGGVFTPSLYIGAMGGYSFGLIADRFWVASSPSNYALIGMGALLAGTMRSPISAVFMVFELTRQPNVILPLMLACILATVVSAMLKRDSVAHLNLIARGVKLDRHRQVDPLRNRKVRDVMKKNTPEVRVDSPLSQVMATLLEQGAIWGFVVDHEGRLTGTIHGKDLSFALQEREHLDQLVVAADLAQPVRETLRPEDDLSLVLKLLSSSHQEALAVVDEEGRRIAEVTQEDVLFAYHQEMSQRDLPSTMVDSISITERLGEIDLGDGYVIAEIEIPGHAVGKTLMELDIRRRFQIHVILLRHRIVDPAGQVTWVRRAPSPTETLQEGDFMLLLGERRKIRDATKI